MEITPEQVRRDLQTVKKKLNTAAVLQDAIDKHQSRVNYLKGEDAASTKDTIISITQQIESALSDITVLENQYMQAILALKPLYKSIILDYYINGIPWQRICDKFHYDKRTILRIAGQAINAISETMKKMGA